MNERMSNVERETPEEKVEKEDAENLEIFNADCWMSGEFEQCEIERLFSKRFILSLFSKYHVYTSMERKFINVVYSVASGAPFL